MASAPLASIGVGPMISGNSSVLPTPPPPTPPSTRGHCEPLSSNVAVDERSMRRRRAMTGKGLPMCVT
eukprot:2962426-Pyramimonas_sp.AAC.1